MSIRASNSDILFSGNVVALVTPFMGDQGQDVNFDVLSKLVEFHANAGTSALVPCGTTGESPTLSHKEHMAVIKTVISASKNTQLKVIAGTGSNSTKEAYYLTNQAAEAGADGCLVVCPYYNKPTPSGVLAHFRELNKIGIPLVVYNIPGRTGINIAPETIQQIANECDNVVGLKASNGDLDQITDTAKRLAHNPQFAILSGDDSLTLPILSVGGVGVISVVANVMPQVMSHLVSSFLEDRDTETSKHIMHNVHCLCKALLQIGSNPAPIKSLMNLACLNVGTCRLPLVPISQGETQDLVSIVREIIVDFQQLDIPFDTTLLRIVEGSTNN